MVGLMKGHNYNTICKKCGKIHEHPKGMSGKKHSKKSRSEISRKLSEGLKIQSQKLTEEVRQNLVKISELHEDFCGVNKVRCLICGGIMGEVTSTHLRYKHNLSVGQYREIFPNATITNERKKSGLSLRMTGEGNSMYGVVRYEMMGDKNPMRIPEVARRMVETCRQRGVYDDRKLSDEHRQNIKKAMQKYKGDNNPSKRPEVRRKNAELKKEEWANLNQKEKEERVRKVLEACHLKPNKREIFLDQIIQTLIPNEFKYVGDGQVIIGGLCPDWINYNGKKQIIELFGGYWHKTEDEIERIERFSKFGFSTLVIWEYELESLVIVITKLIKFVNPENNRNYSLPYFKVEETLC